MSLFYMQVPSKRDVLYLSISFMKGLKTAGILQLWLVFQGSPYSCATGGELSMGFSKLLPRQWLKVSANECCYHHHTCRMLKSQISLPGEEMCLYSKLNQKKERLKGFGTKNSSLPEHEPQSKPYCVSPLMVTKHCQVIKIRGQSSRKGMICGIILTLMLIFQQGMTVKSNKINAIRKK